MSALQYIYPGDRAVEFLVIVALGVALLSSAGWLISRRLTGKPALRHLVLLSALICCLVMPVLAGVSSALKVTLITIAVLPAEGAPTGLARAVVTPEPGSILIEPLADLPSAAVEHDHRGAHRLDSRGVDPRPMEPTSGAAFVQRCQLESCRSAARLERVRSSSIDTRDRRLLAGSRNRRDRSHRLGQRKSAAAGGPRVQLLPRDASLP